MRTMQIAPFVGVILAGGVSSRMGQDKALLPIGKLTMLDHMANLLVRAGASKIVVLGRNDRPYAIPDQLPMQGPAIALQAFLKSQEPGSKYIVVPVDMPAIRPEILVRLSSEHGWTYFANSPLPCLAIADNNRQQAVGSMRELLLAKSAMVLEFLPEDYLVFSNVNTPDGYQKCMNLLRTRKPDGLLREM